MGNAFSNPGTNFDTCVALITSANFSQIHPDWFSNSDPTRPLLLNYKGCELCAGTGSQLWSAQDTLSRFALWVMPAVVLIGHFYFPPLSRWNPVKVVTRLLGDPIDSMWCILIRQEINCRLLRKAEGIQYSVRFEINDARRKALVEAIAVVWMACEEVGWRHLNSEAFERLEQSGIELSNKEVLAILRASRRLTANRSSSKIGTWIAILGMLSALFAAYLRTWIQKLDDQTSHTIAIVSMLTHYMPVVKLSGDIGAFDSSSDAVDVILQLYETLSGHSQTLLFPSLDFHKGMDWELRNQSMDTYDQESSTPNNENESQNRDGESQTVQNDDSTSSNSDLPMANPSPAPMVVPGLNLSSIELQPLQLSDERGQGEFQPILPPPDDIIECWPCVAPAMGMNIIFRPTKSIDVTSQHQAEIPWRLLFYSVAFVMIGSYLPAFFLSYFTFSTLGFGCRCFAWTIIASFWLISFSLNYILRTLCKPAQRLWGLAIAKDSIFAAFFIGTIVWLQVGWVNSCWCRAKVIGLGAKGAVDLMPTNAEEWHKLWIMWPLAGGGGVIFVLVLYLWVSKGTGPAGMVLNKDPTQRHEGLLVIRELQRQIKEEDDGQLVLGE
jgi:hypothetical protein